MADFTGYISFLVAPTLHTFPVSILEAAAASAGALEVLGEVLVLANAALHHPPNQRLHFLLAAV